MPREPESAGLMSESTNPLDASISVKVRKGGAEKKDVHMEVWNAQKGFVSSLKVTDKLKMVYDDPAFGDRSFASSSLVSPDFILGNVRYWRNE